MTNRQGYNKVSISKFMFFMSFYVKKNTAKCHLQTSLQRCGVCVGPIPLQTSPISGFLQHRFLATVDKIHVPRPLATRLRP